MSQELMPEQACVGLIFDFSGSEKLIQDNAVSPLSIVVVEN